MISIRTQIDEFNTELFREFLNNVGLQEVLIGHYINIDTIWYTRAFICYAYREKSDETVAILTHIALKYGNVHSAFAKYKNDKNATTVNTHFNWAP